MKITQKEFDSLYSDSITKKDYDAIITKIDTRFTEIVTYLNPKVLENGWFDYDNCSYGSDGSNGFFEPERYKKEIGIGGECPELKYPYGSYIPTRWLWEDFKEEFDRETTAYEKNVEAKKLKEKTEVLKQELGKKELQKSIKAKLTKDELKVISFR